MNTIIVLASLLAVAIAVPFEYYKPSELEIQQNKNAKYEFASNVDDKINDLTQSRVEVRDGLNLKGTFSYSDGFVKRTVDYVADENGYRIVGEEVVALTGPKVDVNGIATVVNKAHGTELKYSVKSVPVEKS